MFLYVKTTWHGLGSWVLGLEAGSLDSQPFVAALL
jgi:hypothetical protein